MTNRNSWLSIYVYQIFCCNRKMNDSAECSIYFIFNVKMFTFTWSSLKDAFILKKSQFYTGYIYIYIYLKRNVQPWMNQLQLKNVRNQIKTKEKARTNMKTHAETDVQRNKLSTPQLDKTDRHPLGQTYIWKGAVARDRQPYTYLIYTG